MSAIMQRCFKILVYFVTPEYSDITMEQERKHYFFQEQSQSRLGIIKTFFWVMASIICSLLISRL